MTLHVSPDVFGTNTFTVTLKDAEGKPVTGAGVLVLTNSLDMDMGTQTLHLKEVGSTAPGSYSGQTQLYDGWSLAGNRSGTGTIWSQVDGEIRPNSNLLTVRFVELLVLSACC